MRNGATCLVPKFYQDFRPSGRKSKAQRITNLSPLLSARMSDKLASQYPPECCRTVTTVLTELRIGNVTSPGKLG